MTISKEERARWESIWKILRSLDLCELEQAGMLENVDFAWHNFQSDPQGYLIRTGDREAAVIWKAVEKRMPTAREHEALSRTKVGVRVACFTCGLTKKPVGRDAPMAAADAYCNHECPGYRDGPRAGSLWPGESEYDFGYAVDGTGTEERPPGEAS